MATEFKEQHCSETTSGVQEKKDMERLEKHLAKSLLVIEDFILCFTVSGGKPKSNVQRHTIVSFAITQEPQRPDKAGVRAGHI